MKPKPVKNFARKVALLAMIEKYPGWELALSIPTRIFLQVLFRKEHQTDDWEKVNEDGVKAKIYRISEKIVHAFTRRAHSYLRKKAKAIYNKRLRWAETQKAKP